MNTRHQTMHVYQSSTGKVPLPTPHIKSTRERKRLLAKRIRTAEKVLTRERAILADIEGNKASRVRLADKRVLKWECTLTNYRRALESIG